MATSTIIGPFPPLPLEFLEEQLWALRDRVDALRTMSLSKATAVTLAFVDDELSNAAVLLRRPARTAREGVAVLVGQLRRRLEALERDVWPARSATTPGVTDR